MPSRNMGALPAASRACYKCNMRRWTRNRNRNRKPAGDKQAQDAPAPLQPKFPDPPTHETAEERQPEFEAQPDEAELQDSQPDSEAPAQDAAPQQRRDRSRRRGRRGRGGRAPVPAQAPVLPGPGGPTGEGAEAETPRKEAQAAKIVDGSKQSKGAVVLSIGLPGSG